MQKRSKTYKELALEFKETKSTRVYEQLYKKMRPGLWQHVYKVVKNKDAADDIVSQTLTKIYYLIDDYNENYQITTWAYKIAFNHALGHLKSSNKNISLNKFTDLGIEPGRVSEKFDVVKLEEEYLNESNDFYERVSITLKEIDKLPSMYKSYLTERIFNEKSYEEILELMKETEEGINLQTVKNRIFRAKQLIKRNLVKNNLFSDYQLT
jgi:RNA polymerase sigma factor (sigma-70 family)